MKTKQNNYTEVGEHEGDAVYTNQEGQLFLEKDYRYLKEMGESEYQEFVQKEKNGGIK